MNLNTEAPKTGKLDSSVSDTMETGLNADAVLPKTEHNSRTARPSEKHEEIEFHFEPKPVYDIIKRLFDFFVSLVCLLILFIPFLIISVLILIDDHKASPLFVQERVGKNEKHFKIFKFRTMCANAEEKLSELMDKNEMDGPVFKIKDDPRITKIGKFLRATNIDELPQLINIFLGQMSFVGPRPPLPREVEQYRESDRLRLLVVPGLTCYWQATKNRNSISFDEWMEMDRRYIMERSVWVDIKLIFKTFLFIFKRNGC